jgi:hypothetical protein
VVTIVIVGAAVILISVVTVASVLRADARLTRIGMRTTAVVGHSSGGTRYTQASVEVSYIVAGQQFHGTLHGPEAGDLPHSRSIEIIYDPGDPEKFRTDDYANHSDLVDDFELKLPWIASTIAAALLIVSIKRLIQWRMASHRHGWHPWTYDGAIEGRRTVLQLSDNARGSAPVRTVVKTFIHVPFVDPSFSPPADGIVWLSAASGRSGVAISDSMNRPFGAVFPATERQRSRWDRPSGSGRGWWPWGRRFS